MVLQTRVNKLLIFPAIVGCLIFTNKAMAQVNDLPRGYSQTCENLAYDDETGELVAKCQTIDGEYEESSIELNEYITNDNGNLVWNREGNYIQSVGTCNIINSADGFPSGQTYLECSEVGSIDGEKGLKVIVLDEHIENVDGQLKYYY